MNYKSQYHNTRFESVGVRAFVLPVWYLLGAFHILACLYVTTPTLPQYTTSPPQKNRKKPPPPKKKKKKKN